MSRLGRLLGALALAVTSLVMFGAAGTPAYACSCARLSLPAYVEGAEAVFTGTITDREQPGGQLGDVVYTVAVEDVYQGQVAAETVLRTPASSAACGLPGLPAGEPLLFFGADAVGLGRDAGVAGADFSVNLCNGTGTIEPRELSQVEALTGAPSDPTDVDAGETGVERGDASGSEDDGLSPWLLGGIGTGALVLAVLVGVLLRRRARA